MSGKQKLIDYLQQNVGINISINTLRKVAEVSDWARILRALRHEGWQIETLKGGYILHSTEKLESAKKRESIHGKLRYQVLQRDNSTCQRCGKKIEDGIKLEIDHKIPVEWGGDNNIDNLWTLCNICNGGKKHFFSDFDADTMKVALAEPSVEKRLKRFFELNPNVEIQTYVLGVVGNARDWTRALRKMRTNSGLNIVYIHQNVQFPQGAYINVVK